MTKGLEEFSGSSQGRSGSNNTATATTTTTANNSHDASTYPATGENYTVLVKIIDMVVWLKA